MNCKKCGIRLNDSWESCPACGTAVKEEKLCAKCGYKLNDEWVSCPACGAAVEKELLCAKCGYKLNSEWVSCPACGAAVKEKSFCKHCGREIEKNWHICPSCGHETVEKAPEEEFKHNTPGPETAPIEETPVREDLTEDVITSAETADAVTDPVVEPINKPMKWHKFLVYFGIWAVLGQYVLNAVRSLLGLVLNLTNYGRGYYYPKSYLIVNTLSPILQSTVFLICSAVIVLAAISLIKKKKAAGPLMILVSFIPSIAPLCNTIVYIATYSIGSIIYGVSLHEIISDITVLIFGRGTYFHSTIIFVVGLYVNNFLSLDSFDFINNYPSFFLQWILITAMCAVPAILQLIYFRKRKDIYKN